MISGSLHYFLGSSSWHTKSFFRNDFEVPELLLKWFRSGGQWLLKWFQGMGSLCWKNEFKGWVGQTTPQSFQKWFWEGDQSNPQSVGVILNIYIYIFLKIWNLITNSYSCFEVSHHLFNLKVDLEGFSLTPTCHPKKQPTQIGPKILRGWNLGATGAHFSSTCQPFWAGRGFGVTLETPCAMNWMEVEGVEIDNHRCLHSRKLRWPLKMGLPKWKVVFQPSSFRCELLVSGRVTNGNSKISLFSPRFLGKFSNLKVAYFFRWVGSTAI